MNRLPRPIADLIALWRGLALHPREVLLTRCHHQWRGAGFIALIAVLIVARVPGFEPGSLLLALIIGGPSWILDLAGTLAHGLWQSGRIWKGVECQCCGDDPDDGDDNPVDDEPDGDGGLALDIENWLKTQPAPTR